MKRLSNYLLPTFYIGIVVLLVLSSLLVVNGVNYYQLYKDDEYGQKKCVCQNY